MSPSSPGDAAAGYWCEPAVEPDVAVSDHGPSVAASTWLCCRGDAVLAVLPRGSDVYYLPGGMPENEETLAEAAVREVAEEIGVHLSRVELTEIVRVEAEAHGRAGVTVVLVCFAGPGQGEPVPDGDEIVEAAWLRRHEWHRFAPAVRLALADLDTAKIPPAT